MSKPSPTEWATPKWRMTFVNQWGVTFHATEGEVGLTDVPDYIAFCLRAGSILVKMEKVQTTNKGKRGEQ